MEGMFSGDFSNSVQMSLSAREMEIIELVADGLTNQEIAQKLTISKRTVDNHAVSYTHLTLPTICSV